MTFPKPVKAPKATARHHAAPSTTPHKPPKAKTKRKKLPSIKTLREKADKLFSLYIRERDGRCITCGSTENLQCSHYYGKKARAAVRYNPFNAHAQCAKCHQAHHMSDPMRYADWMRVEYSGEALDKLELDSRAISKRDRVYYTQIIEYYEAKGGQK